MNILITGGTGLISTAITRQLLAQGHAVTLYNRGKTPARFPAGATCVQGDRRDYPAFIQQLRRLPRFDAVIEMICFTPEDARSLIAALRGRTDQLIFCSTVDVYARPITQFPIREDAATGGVSDYGRKKSVCEALLLEAHQRGDLPVTIMRPAQTYGEGGVIIHSLGWSTSFIDRMRKGKPLIVHGDGQSLWVACHIDDAAAAFIGALGNPRTHGRCYNVTGDDWMTWNTYHERVAEALGVALPQLVHIPTDLLVRVAPQRASVCATNFQFVNIFDLGAARAELNFKPRISFVEGVRRTVAWLDAHDRIEDCALDGFYDQLVSAWLRAGADMAASLHEPN